MSIPSVNTSLKRSIDDVGQIDSQKSAKRARIGSDSAIPDMPRPAALPSLDASPSLAERSVSPVAESRLSIALPAVSESDSDLGRQIALAMARTSNRREGIDIDKWTKGMQKSYASQIRRGII
jgi:hypothetical protein